MSYYVAHMGTTFRVLFDWHTDGKKMARTVKKAEYRALGFREDMTLEEAKAWARELNKSDHGRRIEARRQKIYKRIEEEGAIECAHLPPLAVERFESDVIPNRLAGGNPARLQKNKYLLHWRTAKRLIRAISLPVSEWNEERARFYAEFEKRAMSAAYIGKLIRILNEWGRFAARRDGKFFEPIPPPDAMHRRRLARTFRERGHSKESAPLSAERLEISREEFDVEEYNWLAVSVWLGLRPEEIDQLKDRRRWEMQREGDIDVLRVFMPKIVTEDEDDSWKLIPLLYFEQRKAVEYIKAKALARPPLAKLQRILGDEYGVYAGRKGFHELMSARGHSPYAISKWLGHLDMRTTDKHYRNKRRVAL